MVFFSPHVNFCNNRTVRTKELLVKIGRKRGEKEQQIFLEKSLPSAIFNGFLNFMLSLPSVSAPLAQ